MSFEEKPGRSQNFSFTSSYPEIVVRSSNARTGEMVASVAPHTTSERVRKEIPLVLVLMRVEVVALNTH